MEDQNCNHDTNKAQVVVLMVPLLAQGHLNQLLHLSHLITSYGISVHYAGYSDYNHQAKLRLHGWDSKTLLKIHFHDFQLSANDTPLDPSVDHLMVSHPIFKACVLLRHPVSCLIRQLSDKFRRVIVIHDFAMTSVVQDVKIIPHAEAYAFNPCSAFHLFATIWEGIQDKEKPFELDSDDFPETMPSQEGCMTPETMDFARYQIECSGFESGWLHNTSKVFEGKYVELVEKLNSTRGELKQFAIGPFHPIDIRSEQSVKDRHECLKWLDKQEKNSVIYVSFGSVTKLSDGQIKELANGLETCGVKFIWVLRKADPNILEEANEVPELPQEYEKRIKDKGIVIRDWAPQLEILGHSSIGGFMSHCGWNSCIESISMGVPLAAWPMHSDQPRNAVLVTQVLKIGVMVRDWKHRNETVMSSSIENAVKALMSSEEGKEIQERAQELGKAVRGSVAKDGVSYKERDSFISHILR